MAKKPFLDAIDELKVYLGGVLHYENLNSLRLSVAVRIEQFSPLSTGTVALTDETLWSVTDSGSITVDVNGR